MSMLHTFIKKKNKKKNIMANIEPQIWLYMGAVGRFHTALLRSTQRGFGHECGSLGSVWTKQPRSGAHQNGDTKSGPKRESGSSKSDLWCESSTTLDWPTYRVTACLSERGFLSVLDRALSVVEENVSMTKESNSHGQMTSSCLVQTNNIEKNGQVWVKNV